MSALDDQKNSYLIEEMKVARQRMDAEIITMNQFEILSFTSIGAIYVAFFQFKIVDHAALVFLSFLSVAICAYGIFRYRAHADIIKIHEDYIKEKIESTVFGGEGRKGEGLVVFYDSKKRSLLIWARLVFWGAIFLVSFAIFILAIACPEYLIRVIPKA